MQAGREAIDIKGFWDKEMQLRNTPQLNEMTHSLMK